MPQFEGLLSYGFWDYVVNVLIYVFLAVSAFVVFWVAFKEKFQTRRIQQERSASKGLLRREIKNSLVALFILTVIDIAIYEAQLSGYTKIYTNVNDYGWLYLILSVVVMILLHDAWFYFTHRFMHHPKIYKYVHKVHHESIDPSPFAAFSFHPLEGIIDAGIFVIFAFAFPVHLIALWAWQLVHVVLNITGHLGYEIYPKGFNKHWLFRFKAPSTHHNMHHEKFNGNFGFYFTWWDKIFKTEFNDYHEVYDRIHDRVEADIKNKERLSQTTLRPLFPQVSEHSMSRKAS